MLCLCFTWGEGTMRQIIQNLATTLVISLVSILFYETLYRKDVDRVAIDYLWSDYTKMIESPAYKKTLQTNFDTLKNPTLIEFKSNGDFYYRGIFINKDLELATYLSKNLKRESVS